MRKTLFVLSFIPVFLLALVAQHALACCIDNDLDGYGIAYLSECDHPDEFDCDDDAGDDPAICATCTCEEPDCAPCARCINPGAAEAPYGGPLCDDGVDNDCDGDIDIVDADCFECTEPGACDDQNPCTDDDCVAGFCVNTNNAAPCDDGNPCTADDVCAEGGCSGVPFDLDADEDGFVSELCGGTDCDDSDPAVRPGAFEGPADDPTCTDGVDNNCNGYLDFEDAGCAVGSACAPAETADAAVYGAPSREKSRLSSFLFALLLPIGAVVLLRRVFRKK
jgi:hypothetical protein